MSELTRAHLPKSENYEEHHIDLCPPHLATVKEKMGVLNEDGVLPGQASEEDRRAQQKNLRETVKNEKIVERVQFEPAPDGAVCLLCKHAEASPDAE